MSNRWTKAAFGAIWILVAAAACAAWIQSDITFGEVPEWLGHWLSQFGIARAALIYIALYTLRPLILFPASLLTIAAGLIFGPWLGILLTVIGENLSANFAFNLARWFGRGWIAEHEYNAMQRWDEKIQKSAFTTVLLMRLIYLPFDLVNYGCGLTSMRKRDFFLGTLIGIMPGVVSFVLLGGAGASGVEHRSAILISSLVIFVLGLIIARWLRRETPSQ